MAMGDGQHLPAAPAIELYVTSSARDAISPRKRWRRNGPDSPPQKCPAAKRGHSFDVAVTSADPPGITVLVPRSDQPGGYSLNFTIKI
jgi:hypothetical protein